MVDVGAFDRVDGSRSPADYVEWMAHQRGAGADGALDALRLGDADTVLDVGCGNGVDLGGLARRARCAVGVDLSMAMAATSRASAATSVVAQVDGQALPFASTSFDACWARAVLVHTPDPQRTVSEIARVLRPGGRVVLSEPDHGTHVVSTPELDVFERVKEHRRSTFRHPLVGRRLGDLVTAAGMTVEATRATSIVHRSLAAARASGGPFDVAVQAAVAAGAITAEEADRYMTSLEELDRRGAFLFAALAVSVAATA